MKVFTKTTFSIMEVNTKTQSNCVNCGLHVVRAGMICAKLSVNVEKATVEGNRIEILWQVLSSAFAEVVQCWKLLVIIGAAMREHSQLV
jgi:chloramphenicol O-acetyltransferase